MAKKSTKSTSRRWVRTVKTDSTHPPPRTFTGSASEIARKMARKDVSPKGYRGGRRLSATRRRELEGAKRILQRRRTSRRKSKATRANARKSVRRQGRQAGR